jgi:hypothetical protein
VSATITTLIAAGIAVLGTLLSPVLVQRSTAKAKGQEYELARRQRQEERTAEAERDKYLDRRAAYTELNAEMRAFVRSLSRYLHLISGNQASEAARNTLNEAREKYLQCYSDAQMRVSDGVLTAAAEANSGLGLLYGMALRIDGLTPPALSPEDHSASEMDDSIGKAFDLLQEVRSLTWKMRDKMRAELGVSSSLA